MNGAFEIEDSALYDALAKIMKDGKFKKTSDRSSNACLIHEEPFERWWVKSSRKNLGLTIIKYCNWEKCYLVFHNKTRDEKIYPHYYEIKIPSHLRLVLDCLRINE